MRVPPFLDGWNRRSNGWLVHEGHVCASLEIAVSHGEKRKGLRGRQALDGALLLVGTRSIHSFGVGFAFDVFLCDDSLRIIDLFEVGPRRITRPRSRVRHIIEVEAGAIDRWGMKRGDQFQVRL